MCTTAAHRLPVYATVVTLLVLDYLMMSQM